MFSKANIKRFNDVQSCAPPPGAYDPKLPGSHGAGGTSFLKANRFPSSEQFAVPMTPTAMADCRKHNGSAARGATSTGPKKTRMSAQARSNSTFSLPTTFDANNYVPGEEDFEIHRADHGNVDDLHAQIENLNRNLDIASLTSNDYKNQLDGATEEIRVLKASEKENTGKLVECQEKIISLESSVVDLQNEQIEKDRKLEQAMLTVSEFKNLLDGASEEIKVLKKSEEEKIAELTECHSKMISLEGSLVGMQNEQVEKDRKLDQAVATSNEYKSLVDSASEEIKVLKASEVETIEKLAECQDKIVLLESSLVDLQNEQIEKLEIAALTSNEYKSQLDAAAEEIRVLQDSEEEKTVKLKEYQEKMISLESLMLDLQNEQIEKDRKFDQVVLTSDEYKKQLDAAAEEIRVLQDSEVESAEQLAECRDKIISLESSLVDMKNEQIEKDRQLEQVILASNAFKHELDRASEELRVLEQSEEEQTWKLAECNKKIIALENSLVDLQNDQIEKDRKFEQAVQTSNEFKSLLDAAAEEIRVLKESEGEKIGELTELQMKIICLESSLVDLQNEHNEKDRQLEIAALTSSEYKNLLDGASDEIRVLKESEEDKTAKLAECQNKISSLESSLVDLQNEQIDKDRKLATALLTSSEYKNLLEGASDEIRVLKESEEDKTAKLTESHNKISSLESSLVDLQNQQIEKGRELEIATLNLSEYKNRLEGASDEIRVLEESNDEKSAQVAECQNKITSLESSFVDLQNERQALETQREELERLNTDLLNQITNQAAEVALLKDELEVSKCKITEQDSYLTQVRLELVETLSRLENERNEKAAIISGLETDLQDSATTVNRLNRELKTLNEDMEVVTNGRNEWKYRCDVAAEEKEKHIQRLKMAQKKLEEYLKSQLYQRCEIDKKNVETLVLKHSLSKLEQCAKSSRDRLATIEMEIAKHASSSEKWKSLHELAVKEIEKARSESRESQEIIGRQQQQLQLLESQNASLERLIGPFKEQLKQYKDTLDVEHDWAARQAEYAKDLADKYAAIVGHQNPKQRIHHMQKLKNDNLTLKNENSQLQKKLTQCLKRLEDLQEKSGQFRRVDHRQAFKHQVLTDSEDTQNVPI